MITSYAVGAVFRIVDEASPVLKAIAAQLNEIQGIVDRTKASLTSLSSTGFKGLSSRIEGASTQIAAMGRIAGETQAAITASFGRMDASVLTTKRMVESLNAQIAETAAASRALRGPAGVAARGSGATGGGRVATDALGLPIATATGLSVGGSGSGAATGSGGPWKRDALMVPLPAERIPLVPGINGAAVPNVDIPAGPWGPRAKGRLDGGGGGGEGGGGGAHFGGPSVPLPGGSHFRMGSGGAAAAAGIIGYGVYEEAQMQDAIFQILYHTGMAPTAENKSKFRDVLQNAMSQTGFGLTDVSEAAKTEVRMFKGTPGGGVDVLPELLKVAAVEARLKGSSLGESMNAFIGLAHMTKEYGTKGVEKMAPGFAFLSASNPTSLAAMERAAGYAVPILQSGLDIDPMQALMLGTVLTRAGITNTKSGTWLRNMMMGALPGTSLMSKIAFKKHEDALKAMGLIDEHDKPTWFTDGKPDPMKFLSIAGEKAQGMDLTHRAAYEKQMMGVQGQGAFSILTDPAIKEQIKALFAEMNSPEFKNRYATFQQDYSNNSSVQKARETWQDLKNVLMDIGTIVLPPVSVVLKAVDQSFKDFHMARDDLIKQVSSAIGALKGAVSGLSGAADSAVAGIKNVAAALLSLGNLKINLPTFTVPGAPSGDRGPSGAPFKNLVPSGPTPQLVPKPGGVSFPSPAPHNGTQSVSAHSPVYVLLDGHDVRAKLWGHAGEFPRSAPAFDTHGAYVGGDYAMVG